MATKNNPGEYDCYEKAEPDEPMFVLLARDPLAAILVEAWAEVRHQMSLETPEKYRAEKDQIAEARECADAMRAWAIGKGKDVEGAQRSFNDYIGM